MKIRYNNFNTVIRRGETLTIRRNQSRNRGTSTTAAAASRRCHQIIARILYVLSFCSIALNNNANFGIYISDPVIILSSGRRITQGSNGFFFL